MPSKSRNRSNKFAWNVKTFSEDGSITHDVDVMYEKSLLAEAITYGTGKQHFNYCRHTQRKTEIAAPTFSYTIRDTGRVFETYAGYPGDYNEWDDYSPNGVPAGFIGRSFQAMQPRFAAKQSLPNFLLELGEIKSLAKTASNAARGLQDLKKDFNHLKRKLQKKEKAPKGRRSKLDRSQQLSDLHLAYAFGVAPLLGDIQAFQNALNAFMDAYDDFVSKLESIQTAHYQEQVDYPAEEVVMGTGTWNVHTSQKSSYSVKYCATMKYRYRLAEKLPPRSKLFLPYYGFRTKNAISVAWQAMPFSFVADWVLRIGDVLESQSGSAIPVDVEVMDYCVSERFERTFSYYIKDRPSAEDVDLSPSSALVSKTRYVYYERTPISPGVAASSWVLPRTDELSFRELLLGGSLANMRR